MNTYVEKVHMLILMQTDIAKAIEFYQKLGLKLIFHVKEKWAEMQLGDIKIGLCPTATALEWHRTGIVLHVADLKETYQALKDQIEFVNEPKEKVHGIMATFKDPAGNLLDLYQPTPDKVADLVKKTAQSDDKQDGEQKAQAACAKGTTCCKNRTDQVAQS